MKRTLLLLISAQLVFAPLIAQYYFTGEVRDSHGDKLPNVVIFVQSTGTQHRTGKEGSFEIMSQKTEDSLLFAVPGYEPYRAAVRSSDFLQVTLRMWPIPTNPQRDRIGAVLSGTQVSFPANIGGMSYHQVRRFLDMGEPVPADAVRIEELFNYFNLYYEEPEDESLFHCSSELLPCPWNETNKLLCLTICTRVADRQNAPPANLVYLVDASGSMDMPNKLSLIQSGFRLLVKNLRAIDTVSLVVYGKSIGIVFQGISGSRKEEIITAIERLRPDGPSPGGMGVKLAYEVAHRRFIEGGRNKVILITDGDITGGGTSRNEMADLIAEQNQAGIQLSCLLVGLDSVRNSELPWLAGTGHGNFALIGDEAEAEKVLLNELAGDLCTVADSVCITANFDTSLVKEVRLIGFDNKRSLAGDTTFRLEGSGIGSGHSLLALFELVPKKDSAGIENIAAVEIAYCLPGEKAVLRSNYNCLNRLVAFDKAAANWRKAASIALFGMKLKASASAISWADVEKMARKNFSGNNALDREYITLVATARKIYEHTK